METAIKKAIEGGYEGLTLKDVETKNYQWDLPGNVLLDPSFWQCLGKALGWKEAVCMYDGGLFNGHKDADTPHGPGEWYSTCEKCGAEQLDKLEFPEGNSIPEWRYNWHRFINHLAEGKDINDFFNQLLK